MEIPDASLRSWDKLAGISGDLADVLLGVLSILSANHGITRIRIGQFYELMAQLNAEFPFIPRTMPVLCEAMKNALQIGAQISADFQHFEIPPDAALENIRCLRLRVGEKFLKNIDPVATRLASRIKFSSWAAQIIQSNMIRFLSMTRKQENDT